MIRRRRPFRAVFAAAALVVIVEALAAGGAPVAVTPGIAVLAAATPTPSTASGDLRSSGEGAGAAGNPGFALVAGLGVLGAGILIALATTAYVRMTSRPRPDS